MKYYQRWIGDYARDTRGLSLLEHGVYTVLLDEYYSSEKPLSNALTELNQICHANTAEERKAVKRVAEKFFPIKGNGRRNARADREIGKVEAIHKALSESGKRGAEKRWADKEIDSPANGHPNSRASGLGYGQSMASQTPDSDLRGNSVVSGEVKPSPGPKPAASFLAGPNGRHKKRVPDPDPEPERVKRAIALLEADPKTTEAEAARMLRVTIDAIREARKS